MLVVYTESGSSSKDNDSTRFVMQIFDYPVKPYKIILLTPDKIIPFVPYRYPLTS